MTITEKDLSDLFDAFNRHDIDGVMKYFADDCVFYAVGGDECFGTTIQGSDAIATAFSGVWGGMKDAKWAHDNHFISGDNAVSEWTFTGTMEDGKRVDARGVDIFKIKDGKIVSKNAFRKQRPLQG